MESGFSLRVIQVDLAAIGAPGWPCLNAVAADAAPGGSYHELAVVDLVLNQVQQKGPSQGRPFSFNSFSSLAMNDH